MGEGERPVERGLGWSHTVWRRLFSDSKAHHPKLATHPFPDRTLRVSPEVLPFKGSRLLRAALGQASSTGNSGMPTHGKQSPKAAGTTSLCLALPPMDPLLSTTQHRFDYCLRKLMAQGLKRGQI